jgi:hypothetical protein
MTLWRLFARWWRRREGEAKRCDASRKDKKKKTLDFGGYQKLFKDKPPDIGRRERGRVLAAYVSENYFCKNL